MRTLSTVKELVAGQGGFLVETRHRVHRYAELGGEEYKTSAFIREELARLGFAVQTVAETAVLAFLDTGRPGRHVLLRADIDALPIPEAADNLAGPKKSLSDNPGCSHTCGHDAHVAILLAAARVLSAIRDSLEGVICFVFEAGEENGYSIHQLMDALSEYDFDAVWAMHVCVDLESGKVSLLPGLQKAGSADIDVTVHGKGGHGARPDLGCNPVFAAAAMLPNMASALLNQLHPEKAVSLGICSIQAGETGNVIPDTARMLGTLRFFDRGQGKKAVEIVRSVCRGTADMFGCTVKFGGRMPNIPLVNNPELVALAVDAFGAFLPEDAFMFLPKDFGAESACWYLDRYPGVYAYLGIRNEAAGIGAAHHTPRFDVDDSVLETGVLMTVMFALAVLEMDGRERRA